MTAQEGPVLDYASPRQRGALRLPSRSVLYVRRNDAALVVTETLRGKPGAVVAVWFAGAALILLASTGVSHVMDLGSRWRLADAILLGVMAGVFVLGLIVGSMVVDNTWRRTVLLANADRISVHLIGPFSKRHVVWPVGQIADVRVVRTYEPDPKAAWAGQAVTLGELLVHAAGEVVAQLFSDHPEADLEPIAEAARAVIASGRGPGPAAPVAPTPLPDVSADDAAALESEPLFPELAAPGPQ
jgi:hypothetical protein